MEKPVRATARVLPDMGNTYSWALALGGREREAKHSVGRRHQF